LKPERWGSLLVQENNREEKACDKRRRMMMIISSINPFFLERSKFQKPGNLLWYSQEKEPDATIS
jgi:hypothetical protein